MEIKKQDELLSLAELIAKSYGLNLVKEKQKEQVKPVLIKELIKKSVSELDRDLSKINSEIVSEEARNKQILLDIVNHLRTKEQIEEWSGHIIQVSGMGKGKIVRTDMIEIESNKLVDMKLTKELIESILITKKKEDLFERVKLNVQGIESGIEVQDSNGGKKWKFKI